MKKKAVFTAVAGSIIALLLTAVLVVGLSTEGFGVRSALQERDSAGTHLTKSDGDTYEYTWDPAEDEITGLSIHWSAGMVDVKVGSGNLIKITEQVNQNGLPEEKRLQLSSSDGVLRIDWGKKRLRFFDFSFFDRHRKDLTVELPRSVANALSELSCSSVSGDVLIGGCTAEETSVNSTSGDLKLSSLQGTDLAVNTTSGAISLSEIEMTGGLSANTVSGEMTLSKVGAETVHMETVSGSARYEGSAGEFHGSSVSAEVTASLSNCPESLSMNAVSGELVLAIPENKGFYADYSSVSGSFDSEFPVTGGAAKSGKALYGDGTSDFSFSTTSGNIRIEKLKD